MRTPLIVAAGLGLCLGPLACHQETLVCQADTECGAAQHCEASGAAARCQPGPRCQTPGQCPASLPVCQEGLCVNPCLQATAPACGDHLTCVVQAAATPAHRCTAVMGCGDGQRQAPEACDGADLQQQSCASLGLGGGTLRCTPGCNFDLSACTQAYRVPSTCGNHRLDAGEACDSGPLVAHLSCASFGYSEGGPLACNQATCQASTLGCFTCGDGRIEGAELCDGGALPKGASCASQGFDSGTLRCRYTCASYDTSQCQKCGNGTREGTEICDGSDVPSTCSGQGFKSGTLLCSPGCQSYDTRQCSNWYALGSSDDASGLSANLAPAGDGARSPGLVFQADGTPLVGWLDEDGYRCVAAATFSDPQWVPVGGSSGDHLVNPGCSADEGPPAVVYSRPLGSALMAWALPASDGNIFVARSSASGWQGLGSDPARPVNAGLAALASTPAVGVSPDANPLVVVVWQQALADHTLRVYGRAWQAGAWVDLPTADSGDGIGGNDDAAPAGELASPQVAVDSNHTIFVAWEGSVALNGTLLVSRLAANANQWTPLPALPTPDETTWGRHPVLQLDAHQTLWLAWQGARGGTSPYGQALVAQLNDGAWVDAGGGVSQFGVQPNPASAAQMLSLAFDPNGVPLVAWQDAAAVYQPDPNELDNTLQIYLRRFIGGAWAGIEGSDSGDGISAGSQAAAHPSVACQAKPGAGSTACVAWDSLTSGSSQLAPHQIQLRCHDF